MERWLFENSPNSEELKNSGINKEVKKGESTSQWDYRKRMRNLRTAGLNVGNAMKAIEQFDRAYPEYHLAMYAKRSQNLRDTTIAIT